MTTESDELLQAMEESVHPDFSLDDLEKMTEFSRDKVFELIQDLKEEGIVECTRRVGKTHMYGKV